jgi:oxygen-independent coproporphyrinogen-3 oxidase
VRASNRGEERKFVPITDLTFEFMLNALRLNDGFSNLCFEARTGLPAETFKVPMEAAKTAGLVEATDNGWKPTDLGRRFLNDLQASFLA